jgi:hypothetical protein
MHNVLDILTEEQLMLGQQGEHLQPLSKAAAAAGAAAAAAEHSPAAAGLPPARRLPPLRRPSVLLGTQPMAVPAELPPHSFAAAHRMLCS